MSAKVDELPKRLQQMIAACQNADTDWGSDEDVDDPGLKSALESTRDWALRLSRGEFEQDLYWDCVADDCEEVGDWQGALSAYQQILNIPDELGFTRAKALSAMASIHRLLGDDKAALKACGLATAGSAKPTDAVERMWLVGEALQLIRMGRIRRARKLNRQELNRQELNRQELNRDPGDAVDHLGVAKLLIASAMCDLATNKSAAAHELLQNAWEWLDALVQSLSDDEDSLRQASGIHITYSAWWATEAERRRMACEGDSEIIALKHAIEKTRLCFFRPCGYQRPWYDLRLMNLLFQFADACERHGLSADAAPARKEAEDIFIARRFPETSSWPRYGDWRPIRFAFLQNWRKAFRRQPSPASRDTSTP